VLPISPQHDSPFFEALAIQIVLGVVSWLIMDFGRTAQVCGIALVAFWGGAAILIWRHPQSPSRANLWLIRFGYFGHDVLPRCLDLAFERGNMNAVPNQPATGKAGIARQLTIGHYWPGLPAAGRSRT
jgi:hypothetical protein